ncbi:hypothetical protein, variant [Verruconis gallopava]|uniref:Chromo domain-containing protein n=1 Tax=Verruconis gallopava TaxID=253628 RepID=A0A0D2AZ43_9PEZI|nr:uncharacterized protein PV09_04689 [Verruconis gallopava]XP_016214284.1 hypothetical protein, variant [Verruconis gallopava]KIW04414.1 hypothetical protein PV09_04689 [Verruconis gallopava]KIW04415.1 hypothetical protein, variant [Verruconis gallopava]
MPRLDSDDKSVDDSIPFKPAATAPSVHSSSNNENGEDEDEYVIEEIVGHDWDAPTGEILYHVKWEGWDNPEDLTWEPEANLASAQDALKQYYKKIGGKPSPKNMNPLRGKGSKKRKATETPKGSVARSKKGRSETPEMSTKKVKKVENVGEVVSWELPKGSWEEEVASIDTIEEAYDDKGVARRYVYLMWRNGMKTRHQLATANQKCPQKLLQYYEKHLVFRSAGPAQSDADVS